MRLIKNVSSGLAVLCFVVASASFAGNKFPPARFVVEEVPMSFEVNAATVDCTSIAQGQFTDPMFPEGSNHQPAIQFVLGDAQVIHLEVGIWDATDCSGEPQVVTGDLDFPTPGQKTVRLRFADPGVPDGTMAGFEWLIGACPITACQGYTSGFGMSPPYVCGILAP